MEKEIPLMQLIDKDGNFNNSGLDSLVKTVGLARCGISYAMVSIMGPQSSGKSTLLNHLFHTSFQEMDAYKRRGQTTQGVWLAKAGGIDPCTLVMDLEGTDGRERGEDDTTFEKQSSLFALAISDIVLVNMWCHDIGREHAANKPLLKTVFQVMMRLFTPRKTTLLFVIRDKTKTPMEVLEPILREDLQKIWNSVPKPSTLQESTLDEFFKVEVTALSSYEAKEEQFKKEVSLLQRRFMNSTSPGGIAGDRRAVVPGAGLALSMQEIWRIIKENKDLDLPAHKVMVATVRCEEIANQKLLSLSSHKDWQDLNERSKTGPVPNLGKSLSHLIEDHICGYDAEAGYFESSVRDTKRKYFMDRALEIIQPAHQAVVGHYRMAALNKFKGGLERASIDEEFNNRFASAVQHIAEECIADFDRGCADAHVDHSSWDLSKLQQKLCRDIETHAESVQNERITCIMNDLKEHLAEALSAPVDLLLSSAATNTWSSIRKLLEKETERAREALLVSMTGFNIDATAQNKLLDEVENFATSTVVKRAREEAAQALVLMKERFNAVFTHDVDSMPRVWSAEDNIREITKDARVAALKLLSVLAVIRLRNDVTDTVLDTLRSSLGGEDVPSTTSASSTTTPLGSTWSDVDPADTLITPVKCKQLWKQFKIETEYTISQALAAQEAIKRGNSWLPPPWAIVAMVVLGFNELMAVIRHPIYMALFFILYLIGKALWVQLDLGQDFQYGLLPGLLSIWTKVLPIGMRILKKLAEEGQQLTSDHGSGVTASNYTTSYQNGTRPPLQKKVQDDVDRVQFTSGNGMATKSFSHR